MSSSPKRPAPGSGPAPRATEPAHHGFGRYVGRVGALAVALGVGVAVTTGHGIGVARADDTSSNSSNSNDSSDPKDANDSGDAGDSTASTPDPGADTEPATSETPVPGEASSSPPQAPGSPKVPTMNLKVSGTATISGADDEKAVEKDLEKGALTPIFRRG